LFHPAFSFTTSGRAVQEMVIFDVLVIGRETGDIKGIEN
jgi:hypothetical protein